MRQINYQLFLWKKNDDEFLTTAFPEVVDLSQPTFYGYPNNYKTYGLTVIIVFNLLFICVAPLLFLDKYCHHWIKRSYRQSICRTLFKRRFCEQYICVFKNNTNSSDDKLTNLHIDIESEESVVDAAKRIDGYKIDIIITATGILHSYRIKLEKSIKISI